MPMRKIMDGLETKTRNLLRGRARARAFVDEINAKTVCAHCGATSIEWHNPEHVVGNRWRFRISAMVVRGAAVSSIAAEIDRCIPLCRRCHMAEDGRLKAFVNAGGNRRPVGASLPPKPCAACDRLYKPLRRGFCARCYERAYRPGRNSKRAS